MPTLKVLPQRYEIKATPDGKVLTCLEAPNLILRVEPGLTLSESAARKSPSGTIFLDGVAQCEPFLDHEKQIYNFDHHEGCIRPFTLSSCEQVMVMVFKGLDLRSRNWSVWVNDPDLDAVLASWLLFNHIRLKQKQPDALQPLIALVRLEGLIDANGLEFASMSGFPRQLVDQTKAMIDRLRIDELALKKDGLWGKSDFLDHVAALLHQIDSLVYQAEEFGDFKEVAELARLTLPNDRSAVVVQADMGIYEIEPYLRRLYGDRLALAALKTGENTYTLRLMDPFMAIDLNPVYQQLNDEDPWVRRRSDASRWGGSADIGGSPRGIGTRLPPEKMLAACAEAFHKPTIGSHLKQLAAASSTAAVIVALAEICRRHVFAQPWFNDDARPLPWLTSESGFWLALLLFTMPFLVFFPWGKFWRYGLSVPCGRDWLAVLPAMVLAAVAGGVHLPPLGLARHGGLVSLIFYVMVIAACCELIWRGLIHGLLSFRTAVQSRQTKWFFSYPNVAAACIYSFFINYLQFHPRIPQGQPEPATALATAFAALSFGLAAGFVRERSISVLPGVIAHMLALALAWALAFL